MTDRTHNTPLIDTIVAKATVDGDRWLLRASGRVSVRAAGDSTYRMAGRIARLPRRLSAASAAEALQVHIANRSTA
jgi:hypothetical protein